MVDAALLNPGAGPTHSPGEGQAVPYVELHLHTCWSLLDGASNVEELIAQAKGHGYPALAITDHDNLFGAMTFARRCKEAEVRPITGMELTLAVDPDSADRHHLTLLAIDRQGYANLCRLASLANGHGLAAQADRERRRLSPCLPLDLLPAHTAGLICLTGCRQGEVPALVAAGLHDAAEAALSRWCAWFGPANVYVELQENMVFGDRARNRNLAALARKVGVATVATGDVHYHVRARHRLQDALVAIRNRTTLDASHRLRRPNSEFFLRRPQAQAARFHEFPEAVANTLVVAERCAFDLTEDLGYRLPAPPVPDGHDPDTWLAVLCHRALAEKYPDEVERAQAAEQLERELRLIRKHGLSGFFLVYNEVLQLAVEVAAEVRGNAPRSRANLPPGRGRGSSVGSVVCYLIGLSHIDPIRKRLFLGRFLNEEMHALPDIDLDFPRDIRDKLFQRVHQRWGPDHAALVATFPTYRIRSAIRDLGKALGLPPRELDKLAKLSEGYGSAKDVAVEMGREPRLKALVDADGWKDLVDLARQLAGFPRHLSQHVGGMVISSDPLVESVPVQPSAWPGRYVCHWEKDSIDDARMVKIDFLALGMLSLVEECLDLVHEHRGEMVDLSRIDFADERVYAAIHEGDTIGVFQIESRAQAQMLPRTHPENLDDLTVQVAIVRPGPIVGGAIKPYVKHREQLRISRYAQPEPAPECLNGVLDETYGAVLFHEQVVQVAMLMGGMKEGVAEQFRRSLSRKDMERSVEYYEGEFMKGAAENRVPEEVAKRYFAGLMGFASFGFPKSHAAAFALLAYQSAWLREHHRPEFYCALYNNQPMGFYPPMVFTNDARRHGVEVLRPDVNLSRAECTVEGDAVRIGLGYVKGVGKAYSEVMVSEREERGSYRSLIDLAHRTGLRREAIENLIMAGACIEFDLTRRELLWQLGLFDSRVHHGRPSRPPARRQLPLSLPTIQDELYLPELDAWERMAADYSILGLSPDSHPVPFLRRQSRPGLSTARELQAMDPDPGRVVEMGGLVVCRQRPSTAKGVVFLLLEDEGGLVNVTVPATLYERHRVLVRTGAFLRAGGALETHAGKVPMLWARRLEPLVDEPALAMPEGKSWG
jgi:error-prone DNA polymerase